MYFSMLLYFEGEVRAGTAGGADINVSCRRRGTGGEREREGRRGGGGLEPSEIVRMAQTDGLKMILVLAN